MIKQKYLAKLGVAVIKAGIKYSVPVVGMAIVDRVFQPQPADAATIAVIGPPEDTMDAVLDLIGAVLDMC